MDTKLPAQLRFTLKIIHLAMAFSIVLFGVAAYVVTASQEPGRVEEALLIAMIAAGTALLIASLVLPGWLASDEHVLTAIQQGRERAGLAAGRGQTPRSELQPLMAGAALLQTAFILRLALTEGVAMMGFVLAVISYNPVYFLPFGGVALVFMALVRFDEERLARLYTKR